MIKLSITRAALSLVIPVVSGCSLGLTDVPDPSTIISPDIVKTYAGAIALYSEATTRFTKINSGGILYGIAGHSFVLASGSGSDEFEQSRNPSFALRRIGINGIENATQFTNGQGEQPYGDMHNTRLLVDQAIGAVKEFGGAPALPLVSRLYSMKGYLYIMFGELYCSGVPFGRAIYGGDIEYGRPKSTEEMFTIAVANFDSALATSGDSLRFHRMALVGKARALLNLKQYALAASLMSVDSIPTDYRFDIKYSSALVNFTTGGKTGSGIDLSVASELGGNGLNYRDAGAVGPNQDPRVAWYMSVGFNSVPYPAKYVDGLSSVVLASGIEARLIEAEAKLNASDFIGWANILNSLRQNATPVSIPHLTADSTTNASLQLKEDVTFRERAFWLYATGHRFGDMRRLVRQYGRSVATVFPTGSHPALATPNNIFSEFPNFAPPQAEAEANPYFSGCQNRDA